MATAPDVAPKVGPAGIAAVAFGAVFWMSALAMPSFYSPGSAGESVAGDSAFMFGMATMIPGYIASLVGIICATRELAVLGKRAVIGYLGLAVCVTPTLALVAWLMVFAGSLSR